MPTTRLCIELLATSERGSLLDVGCGSGVLAIAASRLGFDPILAVDNDPVAIETTIANAAANGVVVEASLLDGEVGELPRVDVAVVNVLLAPVERILARLDARSAITSGYLARIAPWRQAGVGRTARARRLGGGQVRAAQCAQSTPERRGGGLSRLLRERPARPDGLPSRSARPDRRPGSCRP